MFTPSPSRHASHDRVVEPLRCRRHAVTMKNLCAGIGDRERNIGVSAVVDQLDATMNTEMTDEIAGPEQARLFTRIALNTWKATVGRFDDIVAACSDEELERE